MHRFRVAAIFLSVLTFVLVTFVGLPLAVEQATGAEEETTKQPAEGETWQERVDKFFGEKLVAPLESVLFFDFWSDRWLRSTIPDDIKSTDPDCPYEYLFAWTVSLDRPYVVLLRRVDTLQKEKTAVASIAPGEIVPGHKGSVKLRLGKQGPEFEVSNELPAEVAVAALNGQEYRVLQAWPADEMPIVIPCPDWDAELETGQRVPLVVLWLLVGAIFFTVRMGFINFRGFLHGLRLIRGSYDNPEEAGEVSHFQALASALSATIGLGNIAGVAIAVGLGGPGTIFWMIVAGLLGMTSKFTECSLSQMYRKIAPDGTVSGGPMHYLYVGLKEIKVCGVGLGPIGAVLAVIFALFCMGGSFGGGCAFQVSQSQGAIRQQMLGQWPAFADCHRVVEVGRQPGKMRSDAIKRINRILEQNGVKGKSLAKTATGADARQRIGKLSLGKDDLAAMGTSLHVLELADMDADELARTEAQFGWGVRLLTRYLGWMYGTVMAVLVGLVIIGGIRRIAATAEKIVPLMCVVYVLTSLCILAVNYDRIGWAFAEIFSEAFQWRSVYGGVLGVLVVGLQRAAFSNEAGVGSAAIAHAAAKTEEPIREGIVASLGPFIDTVVICTMTGLVIVITGVYDNPAFADMVAGNNGAALTTEAFGSVVKWFPWILCMAVVLFAYSTMISWSYYGERCWSHLTGNRWALGYRLLFLAFVVLGAVVTANNVLVFSDLMILSMAFPNILGVALLSGRVRRALDEYWKRYKAGEMEPKT